MLYVFAMGNIFPTPHTLEISVTMWNILYHTQEFASDVKNSPICTRKEIWAFLFLSHPLMICLLQNEFIVDWKPSWAFSIYQNFPVWHLSSATTCIHHFFFSCLQSIVSWMGRKHGNSDYLYGKKIPFTYQTRFCLAFACTHCSTHWGTSLVGSKLESPQVGSVP